MYDRCFNLSDPLVHANKKQLDPVFDALREISAGHSEPLVLQPTITAQSIFA